MSESETEQTKNVSWKCFLMCKKHFFTVSIFLTKSTNFFTSLSITKSLESLK